jgi:hypothetical protein
MTLLSLGGQYVGLPQFAPEALPRIACGIGRDKPYRRSKGKLQEKLKETTQKFGSKKFSWIGFTEGKSYTANGLNNRNQPALSAQKRTHAGQ